MAVEWGSVFETDSPAEAAKRFKHASIALVASVGVLSVLFWMMTRDAVRGPLPQGLDTLFVLLLVVAQGAVAGVFVRTGIEYLSWVTSELDWL